MTHEPLTKAPVHRLSDRKFGLTFGASLAVLGCFPLIRHHPVRLWALIPSAIFILTALIFPKALGPINWFWSRVTSFLNTVLLHVSGAFLLIFIFAPANLLCRIMGRDQLRLRRDPSASTYWITKNPPGPAPETMINQF